MSIFKQYHVPKLGAIVDSLYTSLPVLSIINFLSIITVLYATIRENLFQWFPWLSFGWFIIIMTLATFTMMVTIYKFVLQSLWTFRNRQMNTFESDILTELKELRKEVKDLRKEVKDERDKCSELPQGSITS